MANDKEIAEFFRLALSLQLASCNEVEHWADTVVDREEHPRHPIVELALATERDASVVSGLLSEVKGEANALLPPRMVLALLRTRLANGAISLEATVKALYGLYQASPPGLTEKEENHILRLEDAWSLARDGIYGGQKSVGAQTIEFLQDYLQYEKELPW